ncbi:hypothetical protein [Plantibacter sp. CFBP 13570]|uniref:hypothetical protein n=1 Tax=Plantibacter sp. CFBP 13570 TaxID=2775272 RepID=UPI001930B7B9|nr:hypothetical protein [Plantibacter sp. CFBP 13570]MBD8533859.1 hypothetical protein [Plantibacter sp. CFBP 13570]
MRKFGPGALTLAMAALVLSACTAPASPSSPKPTISPSTLAPGNEIDKDAQPTAVPPEVVLVFASMDEDGASASASAYVAGVLENGGVCTFSFTLGDTVVTREAEGLADKSTTTCGTVQVPVTELSTGTWTVAVQYASATTPELASTTSVLEIP